jgi:hypothetical protein
MFEHNFELLKQEALNVGYIASLISNEYASRVMHDMKVIGISRKMGDTNAIFEFAHELGHCKQYEKIYQILKEDGKSARIFYQKSNQSKTRFLMKEVDAWIKGYSILKRNNISTKGYVKHASFCVGLYIRMMLDL